MNNEDRAAEFLTLFRELEQELCSISRLKDSYVSFSRALNEVHYNKLNPVIASSDVYDLLKTASDLRNLLSHRNDVAEPTEEFLRRFKIVVKNVVYPTSCLDAATKGDKIVKTSPNDNLLELIKIMELRGLSHIPVYSHNKEFLGVFSRTSLFEYVSRRKNLVIDNTTKIGDLVDVIDINKHKTERYLFVSKNTHVIDVYQYLVHKKNAERRVSCIFITKNGKQDEPLLGVVTEVDLLKVAIDLD